MSADVTMQSNHHFGPFINDLLRLVYSELRLDTIQLRHKTWPK